MKKSFLIGTLVGVVGAMAVLSQISSRTVKRAKRAFINKLEDTIM